jgi:hypothetical protein
MANKVDSDFSVPDAASYKSHQSVIKRLEALNIIKEKESVFAKCMELVDIASSLTLEPVAVHL